MSQDSPLDEANEADLAEQEATVEPQQLPATAPETDPDQANEADVLEQHSVVDEEIDDYPHVADEPADT